MIKTVDAVKIRSISNYAYKEDITQIAALCEKFLENNHIAEAARIESRIPKEKNDVCYHLEFKNNIATMYENGNVEIDDETRDEKLKDFEWFFLKFYDESLNDYIGDNIKQKYSSLIERIKSVPITYGAFHYCTDNTFIFEHYDQVTRDERSETGRTNIIVPLCKPDSKGCIIHVDGDAYDLMDYDAFCFNAQFKHKMYNNTGSDVVLLVLHSRTSDFEIAG